MLRRLAWCVALLAVSLSCTPPEAAPSDQLDNGDDGAVTFGDASRWGVNAHLPDDAIIDLIAAAGIKWVRLSISWQLLEETDDVIVWDVVDERVAAARAHDLDILMTISGTPTWASSSGQVNAAPTDPSEWAEFIEQCVTRYKDEIKYWGLWNEPNGGGGEYWSGTAVEFRDLILIPGAAAVKRADPTGQVVGPGITIHTGWTAWMDTIFAGGGAEAIDVIAVHCYVNGDADDLFWQIDERLVGDDDITPLEVWLQSLDTADKPVWLEESGWTTAGTNAVTEAQQADYLHGLLWGIHEREVIDRVFTYAMIDDGEADPPDGFGLVRSDYTTKPAYDTYRAFIATPTEPTTE